MGSAESPGRQTSAQFASPAIPLLRSSFINSTARVSKRQPSQTTACLRARYCYGQYRAREQAVLPGKRLRFFAPAALRQILQMLRRIAFALDAILTLFE